MANGAWSMMVLKTLLQMALNRERLKQMSSVKGFEASRSGETSLHLLFSLGGRFTERFDEDQVLIRGQLREKTVR